MQTEALTLSKLNQKIEESLENAFPSSEWIVAEIMELNVNRSGHCYLELVEKSELNDQIIAKSRATIWSSRFGMLRSYFESSTNSTLTSGIKVLVKVMVSFHSVYGLSLNIIDIDPKYTLGDLAAKRQEILKKLEEAGVMNMNRDLEIEDLPQKLAVISSETAAGFGDFIDSLFNNSYNYGFKVDFYPALMQGENAELSIIHALDRIFNSGKNYDAIVLIRGGGSQSDLNCFNAYDLALNIAQFPIPVLTGIGHERDQTIADMVAHKSLKTPTAVAEFLIDNLLEFESTLKDLEESFEQQVKWIIQKEEQQLKSYTSDFKHLTKNYLAGQKTSLEKYALSIQNASTKLLMDNNAQLKLISSNLKYMWKAPFNRQEQQLNGLQERLSKYIKVFLENENNNLTIKEKSLELLRPEKVLSRGYSITYYEGKAVKTAADMKAGMKLKTHLAHGNIISTVSEIEIEKKK